MEDILDAWAKGLRDAGWCVSGFINASNDTIKLNGKFGECVGTEDEDHEEIEKKSSKRKHADISPTSSESDEETDKKVAQKVREVLNSLDITSKTLKPVGLKLPVEINLIVEINRKGEVNRSEAEKNNNKW